MINMNWSICYYRDNSAYYLKKVSRTQEIAESTLGGTKPTHTYELITDPKVIRLRRLAKKLAQNDKRQVEKKYKKWHPLDAARALHEFFNDEHKHSLTYAVQIKQKKKRPAAPNGEIYAAVGVR